MIEINLLPGVTRKTKRSNNIDLGAFTRSIGDRIKNPYMIAMVAAFAISASSVGMLYASQSMQTTKLDERRDAAVRDSAKMAGVLKARNKAEAARDSVYMQVAIIKSIDDSRFKWPHLLQEINLAIPPYTWLLEVTQTSAVTTAAGAQQDSASKKNAAGAPAAKPNDTLAEHKAPAAHDSKADAKKKRAHADSLFNGTAAPTKFRIVGQTVDIQALTLFMKNLEGSPFIKNVQLTRSDLVSGEHDVTQFELEAETETPPESLLSKTPLSIAIH